MKREQFAEVMKQLETYIKNGQAMKAANYVREWDGKFTAKQYEKANHRVYEAMKTEGHNI